MLTEAETAWRDLSRAALANPDTPPETLQLAGAVAALIAEAVEYRRVIAGEPLLTRAQVAKILGVSPDTVSTLAADGRLEASAIGERRQLRVRHEAVMSFLAASRLDAEIRRFEMRPRAVPA